MMADLWKLGYAAEDIIGNIFRVTKSMQMSEELKLDFIKVVTYSWEFWSPSPEFRQVVKYK